MVFKVSLFFMVFATVFTGFVGCNEDPNMTPLEKAK